MAYSITFFVSLFLLVLFGGVRFFEHRRGRRFFDSIRTTIDVKGATLYQQAVRGNIPLEWRRRIIHLFHTFTHSLIVITVDVLRAIEGPLMRLSYRLRTHVPKSNGKDVSPYLKTITPKKNNGGNDNGITT